MRFTTRFTLCAVAGAICSAGADASIVAAGGDALQIAPPPDATVGMLESNTEIFVWDEKQLATLPVNMPLDIDGTPGIYDGLGTLTGGVLPAGAIVSSHFIHFDQVGPGATGLTGFVEFDSPIVGVQVRDPRLDAGDIMGVGTIYPTGFLGRQVDWFAGGPVEEIRISPDRKRMDFFLVTSNAMDQIRVFTDPLGAADTDKCHLSWDVPCCLLPDGTGLAKAVLTICNCDNEFDKQYFFDMVSDSPGLLGFAPDQGVVLVPAGQCVDIPIDVLCSPNIPVGGGALFHANITNLTMGGFFRCDGSVRQTGDTKVITPDPVVPGPVDVPVDLPFQLRLPGGFGEPVELFFEAMPAGQVELGMTQMTVAPPNTEGPVIVGLLLPAIQKVRAAGTRAPGDVIGFTDVVISWDQNGDGVPEPGASIAVKGVQGPCIGDLNGDGLVNGADLGLLLGAWGPCP